MDIIDVTAFHKGVRHRRCVWIYAVIFLCVMVSGSGSRKNISICVAVLPFTTLRNSSKWKVSEEGELAAVFQPVLASTYHARHF